MLHEEGCVDDDYDCTDGPDLLPSTSWHFIPSREQTQEYIENLKTAVSKGDRNTAAEIAAQLANWRIPVLIKVDGGNKKSDSDLISVKFEVMKKDGDPKSLTWRVHPSIAVHALKMKMYEKYGFLPGSQRWIIGDELVSDEQRLSDFGITNNSTVYVYIVSPVLGKHQTSTSRLIADETSLNQHKDHGQQTASAGGSSLTEGQSLPTRGDIQQQSQQQPVQPVLQTRSNSQALSAARETRQMGWHCRQCTYINQPTRPGCEMCATERPADYRLPADHQLTDDERRQLLLEQQMDELAITQQSQFQHEAWQAEGRVGDFSSSPVDQRLYSFDMPMQLLSGEFLLSRDNPSSDEEYARQIYQQEQMFARYEQQSSRHLELDSGFRS